MQNEGSGQIKNVFSLISADDIKEGEGKGIGNIVGTNASSASIENVYSVGLGKNITNIDSGTNIYSAGGKISNNY